MDDQIKRIFFEESLTKAYKRINSFHPVDIYLGYNQAEEMSMVIIESGSCSKVEPSRAIHVNLEKREDGRLKLEFSLKEISFQGLFFKLCEDLISVSENAKKGYVLSDVVRRWKSWQLMLSSTKQELLSSNEIQGLIGELFFMKKELIPKIGAIRAIDAWEGPMGGDKDFIHAGGWVEVKTCPISSDKVRISSLEQLDSDAPGTLAVIRMDKSNKENPKAINLNEMIGMLRKQILDTNTLGIFHSKLQSFGYEYNAYYDEMSYMISGLTLYKVDDDFPKIRRSDVPTAIDSVQYDLRLSNLKGEC